MATSSLVLHRGAREVTLEELRQVQTPQPTDSHFPIPFERVLDITLSNLRDAGFEPTRQRLALHKQTRFFATIDLASALVPGVTLAVALRSSHDASLAYGFVAGNRTFCCDNLALSSDLSIFVRRKHTKFGEERFASAMAQVIREKLPQFAQNETARIMRFQQTGISDTEAESSILRSHELGIVSHRYLLRVLKEFRQPSFEEFTRHGKTLWRLENAFTTVLGEMGKGNPQRYAKTTIALQGLLSSAPRPSEMVPLQAV